MNRLPLLLSVLVFCIGARAQAPTGYKLAFSDEFNGKAIDPGIWAYRTDSKLESTQMPANVSVRDGRLVIALRKQDAADKHYTGGGIISRKAFRYGYYEARIRIAAGSGWHSSFWLQRYNGVDTRGDKATLEMDVVENTSDDLTSYSTTTHRWVPPHIARGHKDIRTPDLSRAYHVFGCEYAPDMIRYYFDGQLVQTVDWTGLPQGDVNIWLTSIAQAMGPQQAIDDSALPGAIYVDWVRFYTRP